MKCFLIMPFGNSAEDPALRARLDLLHGVIREVVESISDPDNPGAGLTCVRGDQKQRPGEIVRQIVDDLVTSEFAIAVLTGHNPNVFYELGVRHAVKNHTILMAERAEEVPFDLRSQRMILYSLDAPRGIERLQVQLRSFLLGILGEPGGAPDNPVLRVLQERAAQPLEEKFKHLESKHDAMVGRHLLVTEQLSNVLHQLGRSIDRETPPVAEDIAAKGAPPTVDPERKPQRRKPRASTVAVPQGVGTPGALPEGWKELEGVWVDPGDRSHYYFTRVGEVPVLVFGYRVGDEISGVHDNIRMDGGQILGRFQWNSDPSIRGFTTLERIDPETLRGGWWTEPGEERVGRVGSPIRMVPIQLRRRRPTLPRWAADWVARRFGTGPVGK
jgi:hypothetical protein